MVAAVGSFDCIAIRWLTLAAIVSIVGCGDPPAGAPVSDPLEASAVEAKGEVAAPSSPSATPTPTPTPGQVAVQRSMLFEEQGQLELAASAADEAIAAHGGRPARLQAAKIAILRERWDEAESYLRPLVEADPQDADGHYNLGLVAHRRGRYNDARAGYLAALRAREDYPDARFNLALLTWERDVKQEARHHVARFVERWPDDPRGAELTAMIGGTPQEGAP